MTLRLLKRVSSPLYQRTLFPKLTRMCSTVKEPVREVLPTNVIPKHYRLFLEPDLSAFTYKGQVEIDLDIKTDTKAVTLNILDLVTKNVKLGSELAVSAEHDVEKQTITWEFASVAKGGSKKTLSLDFDGTLNDKLAGFYRSVHKDQNGVEKVVATTQMEATDCRRAFPCFDEPALKATFDVTIAAPADLTVLSNSDVKMEEHRDDGKKVTHFNTTPKMSTYLVAFIVGDLKYVECNDFRVPVRVYATPGLETRCQFSANLAAKTLKFFEDTFDIPYPLPKCDMVGIHDFSAGAMENWGLITYRLVDLFYEEGKDSTATKIRVAEVVQHELAHQWFGNLVTMDWWEGLWLNEGYATWMSWYSSDHFFPEWKVWETYVNREYQSALALDGLRSSHPIEVPVNRADEINQIFDAISYMKGSCVIRMVSKYLGEDVFIKGISHYLKRHAYGNTTTRDLWQALSEVSGKDVESLMGVWTKQVGYPVVSVKEEGSKIDLEQHRFLVTRDVSKDEDLEYPVWLSLRLSDGSVDSETFLKSRNSTIDIDPEFYKLNADQNGIFRVLYPAERIEKLAVEGAAAPRSRLSTEDRMGLLADVRALSGGYVRTSQLLTLASKWRSDPEPNVWSGILTSLGFVASKLLFESESVREAYKSFRTSVVIPKAEELGHSFSKEDSASLAQLKSSLFGAAVSLEDPEHIKYSLDLFADKGFSGVNANLRASVFRAVSSKGTTEQWHQLLDHYTAGTNGASGIDAILSLGSTHNADLRKKLRDSVLDGTVRSQDSVWAIAGLLHRPDTLLETWDWIKANWERLTEMFPMTGTLLMGILKGVLSSFTKVEHLNDVEKFFNSKDLRGISMGVAQCKDQIKAAIKFLESDLTDIKQWLKQSRL